jgi:hypothetical protein
MDRFKEAYPDIFRRIEAQTLEPQMASVGALNPVTGMPITPVQTSSSGGSSSDDGSPHPIHNTNKPDNGEWGFFDSGSWSFDPSYNPVDDFTDWLSGGYNDPMDDPDFDHYSHWNDVGWDLNRD